MAACGAGGPVPGPGSTPGRTPGPAWGCAGGAAEATPAAPTVALTEADQRQVVQASVGETLTVSLAGAPWTEVCSSDPFVLAPVWGAAGGRSSFGLFRAVAAGQAELVCTTAAGAPGTARPVQRFSVTVVVEGS